MTLATTVTLAVVRGPVAVAKSLGAIDRLSGGRLVVAVGPGSSARGLLGGGHRLRRALATVRRIDRSVARVVAARRDTVRRPLLFDGGCVPAASARAAERTTDLDRELGFRGRAPSRRPPGRRLAGIRLQHHAGAVRGRVAGPRFDAHRPRDDHRRRSRTRWPRCGATSRTTGPKRNASSGSESCRRCTGPRTSSANGYRSARPSVFAEKLSAFARSGVQRVFIWPVADEVHQLERFWNEVRPLVVAP